jgi:hypothetical protein
MQQFFLMFTVMNLTDCIIKYIFPLQFAKFWTPISRISWTLGYLFEKF